ncbi:receptor-like protein 6 [Apium graveolens]|uniref:receptor-like protein 6 n=1 Tax=Apium graveolens TaxID=4045 RepID=UPI003D78F13B
MHGIEVHVHVNGARGSGLGARGSLTMNQTPTTDQSRLSSGRDPVQWRIIDSFLFPMWIEIVDPENLSIESAFRYTETQKAAMRTSTGLLKIIIILLFWQHHVAVSSLSAPTTHLGLSMQKLALFQFKLSLSLNTSASTHCTSYPKTMNWSMSSDCCTWDGVTCDLMKKDVIGLDLQCSQLVGVISPNSTLFRLSLLQFIDFNSNDLHGVLPEEIFNLPNLKHLSVKHNSNLTISLPKIKWGSSSSLQILSLADATLSGGIPDSIAYLKSLTDLSLWGCKISGPIPRTLGNLTQLALLDLAFNQITGRIPDYLANLPNLEVIFLNNNNLIGQFPFWIDNLRQLVVLDLSHNSLTGPLPSNLTALYFPRLNALDLANNKLNGTIPSWLFDIPSLRYLSVDYNEFRGHLNEFESSRSSLEFFFCRNNLLNGTIPQSFSKLVNLTFLDFSSNNFSGILDLELYSHLEYLKTLILSYNSLSVRITSTTTLTPNLRRLGLSSCKVMNFPNFLRYIENLEYLDLSNNQIDGEIPQWIGSLLKGSFSSLNLSHNSLTGGIEHFPLDTLRYLDLHFNMLNGSLPASICNSSSLNLLNLSHNNLSGVLPICPENIEYSLSVLDLRMNSITGNLPSTLSNFRKLRSLNLYGNKLKGTIPLSFAEFPYLEVLDLGSNQIHDTFPQCLESLPSLQVLVLKSNKFHGFINNNSHVDHPFSNLRIIDLSCNEFSGLLPAKYIKNFNAMMNGDVNKIELDYMGDSSYRDSISIVIKRVNMELVRILTVLTTIDLSGNKFEGEIPEYTGNLKSLRYLNLSHNHLTGHIPSLISKLEMLESLDLSFNRLVGAIPPQLTAINTLSHLNLSQNDLSGRIPQGAQFYTFENDSYAGNLGLCGRPLPKNGFTWKAMVMGYGSGVVLGFVIEYMMFMAGKPTWFVGIIARELGLKRDAFEWDVVENGFTIPMKDGKPKSLKDLSPEEVNAMNSNAKAMNSLLNGMKGHFKKNCYKLKNKKKALITWSDDESYVEIDSDDGVAQLCFAGLEDNSSDNDAVQVKKLKEKNAYLKKALSEVLSEMDDLMKDIVLVAENKSLLERMWVKKSDRRLYKMCDTNLPGPKVK